MNSFRISVYVQGVLSRQRSSKRHNLDAGRIEVEGPELTATITEQATEFAKLALLKMKQVTSTHCQVSLNYFKVNGPFEQWEPFGPDNHTLTFEIKDNKIVESTLKKVA